MSRVHIFFVLFVGLLDQAQTQTNDLIGSCDYYRLLSIENSGGLFSNGVFVSFSTYDRNPYSESSCDDTMFFFTCSSVNSSLCNQNNYVPHWKESSCYDSSLDTRIWLDLEISAGKKVNVSVFYGCNATAVDSSRFPVYVMSGSFITMYASNVLGSIPDVSYWSEMEDHILRVRDVGNSNVNTFTSLATGHHHEITDSWTTLHDDPGTYHLIETGSYETICRASVHQHDMGDFDTETDDATMPWSYSLVFGTGSKTIDHHSSQVFLFEIDDLPPEFSPLTQSYLKYITGSTTPKQTIGVQNHKHSASTTTSLFSCTETVIVPASGEERVGISHHHEVHITSASSEILPPYITFKLGELTTDLSSADFLSDVAIMATANPPLGYFQLDHSSLDVMSLQTALETGGSFEHTHEYAISDTTERQYQTTMPTTGGVYDQFSDGKIFTSSVDSTGMISCVAVPFYARVDLADISVQLHAEVQIEHPGPPPPTDDNDNDDDSTVDDDDDNDDSTSDDDDDDDGNGAAKGGGGTANVIAIVVPVAVVTVVGALVIVGVLGFFIVVLLTKLNNKKKRNNSTAAEKLGDIELDEETIEKAEAEFKINTSGLSVEFSEIELKKEIARGVDATLYLAQWEGRQVVCKVFSVRDLTNQLHFEQLEKELEIMTSLNHPNVLRFFAASLKPPRTGIIMEYCSNRDLEIYMKNPEKEPLSLLQKFIIFTKIVHGLEHIHKRKIIHRDLKCRNIFLTSELEPKIADFGISRTFISDDKKKLTKMVGTAHYIAPEVCIGDEYDSSCDIYSLAIIFWEVYHENFQPYGDVNFNVEVKVAMDPTFRPDITDSEIKNHPKFFELMQRMWNFDPKERPSLGEISEYLKEKVEMVRNGISVQGDDKKVIRM